MRLFSALSALLLMGACTTPYQPMGLMGGVNSVRITENTAQIVASGNAYTDPATIQRYALRRAAEETVNDGFDLFRIGGADDTTRVGATSFGSAYGGRYGVYGSSFSMPVVKPGQTLIIRMLKGPAPDPMPDGMYDAHEVLKFMATADHKNCQTVAGSVVCK